MIGTEISSGSQSSLYPSHSHSSARERLDLFTLSDDSKTVWVHLWNRGGFSIFKYDPYNSDQKADTFRYDASHSLTLSVPISNVVPGDFNYDGRLDLLVMHSDSGGWWDSKSNPTHLEVYLGGAQDGGFRE